MRDHQDAPKPGLPETEAPGLVDRVADIWTIQCNSIGKDRSRFPERDAVFRKVGLSLPLVPLEHLRLVYTQLSLALGGALAGDVLVRFGARRTRVRPHHSTSCRSETDPPNRETWGETALSGVPLAAAAAL